MPEYLSKIDKEKLMAALRAGRGILESDLGKAGPRKAIFIDKNEVKVEQNTGGDLLRGAVVKIGDELLDEKQRAYPWFEGTMPDATDNAIAVLIDPAKSGKIVPAQVTGRCIARVDIVDVDHAYADVTVGQPYFTSQSTPGPVRLIGTEPAQTGVQEVWAVLPRGSTFQQVYRFKLLQALDFGETKLASLVDETGAVIRTVAVEDTIDEHHGAIGYSGWCVLMPDNATVTISMVEYDLYEILFLQAPTRFLEATLTAAVASGSATATITRAWGSAPNGFEQFSGTQTVYDPQGVFEGLASGSKVKLVYDEEDKTSGVIGKLLIWWGKIGSLLIKDTCTLTPFGRVDGSVTGATELHVWRPQGLEILEDGTKAMLHWEAPTDSDPDHSQVRDYMLNSYDRDFVGDDTPGWGTCARVFSEFYAKGQIEWDSRPDEWGAYLAASSQSLTMNANGVGYSPDTAILKLRLSSGYTTSSTPGQKHDILFSNELSDGTSGAPKTGAGVSIRSSGTNVQEYQATAKPGIYNVASNVVIKHTPNGANTGTITLGFDDGHCYLLSVGGTFTIDSGTVTPRMHVSGAISYDPPCESYEFCP